MSSSKEIWNCMFCLTGRFEMADMLTKTAACDCYFIRRLAAVMNGWFVSHKWNGIWHSVARVLHTFFIPGHQRPRTALFLSFSGPFPPKGTATGTAVRCVGVLDDPESRRLDPRAVVKDCCP